MNFNCIHIFIFKIIYDSDCSHFSARNYVGISEVSSVVGANDEQNDSIQQPLNDGNDDREVVAESLINVTTSQDDPVEQAHSIRMYKNVLFITIVTETFCFSHWYLQCMEKLTGRISRFNEWPKTFHC